MSGLAEVGFGIAVAAVPFVAVGSLLWLRGRMLRRESLRIRRQIALTDAIHWELGAAAAPEVRQGWLGGWTVSAAVPFQQEATVGAVVRIAHDFFSELDLDEPRLRIVLTSDGRRPGRRAEAMLVNGPTAPHRSRPYPPWVWSRNIPAAISAIANKRTHVNGSCSARKPASRTSAVEVPPMISDEVTRNPRS